MEILYYCIFKICLFRDKPFLLLICITLPLFLALPLFLPFLAASPTFSGFSLATAFSIFSSGLRARATRCVKSHLYTAQGSSINIQILKPLRTSTNENEDNFLVIGEIKNIKMKPHARFHRYFKGVLHTLS